MMDKLPEASAKECSQRFPIKETIDTVTIEDREIIEAYEEEFKYMSQMIDSLLSAKCDTLYIDKIKEKIRQIPCKPEIKYIIKTQENTAKLAALQAECDKKQSELVTNFNKSVTDYHALKDKNAKLQIRNIWLWIIIVLLTIFSFRRQIFNLIK
jgi:hypothetical protein